MEGQEVYMDEQVMPGGEVDEYQRIILENDAWMAAEQLAEMCRRKDKEKKDLQGMLASAGGVIASQKERIRKQNEAAPGEFVTEFVDTAKDLPGGGL